jgi:uncharacterized protein
LTLTDLIGVGPATVGIAAAMTFGSAVIRGLTGFGMAIILVPLLGLLIAPTQAVALAIILQLLIGPVGLPRIMADADHSSAVPIAVLAMGTTPLGMAALATVNADVARLLIALVALGAFAAILLPRHRAGHKPGRAAIGATGIAAGILTGFAAMPGPPVVPFYLRQRIDPMVVRASMMLIFFASAIAGTLAALWTGVADRATFVLAAVLFVPMWAGNALGALAFGRVPAPLWRGLVGTVLGVAAIGALARLLP